MSMMNPMMYGGGMWGGGYGGYGGFGGYNNYYQ